MSQAKPIMYLFIGYPGAGKTTVAKIIAHVTGAHHLWADQERHKLYPNPTHSEQESQDLYEKLNSATDYLLSEGKSVVFDTNFNFLDDREKLREIADKNSARTIIIWLATPKEVSRNRAVTEYTRNNYDRPMTNDQFDKIASKLEEPTENEEVIKIDGTDLNQESLFAKLHIKN
jgi:predicted kinase